MHYVAEVRTEHCLNRSLEQEFTSGTSSLMRNTLTKPGKLGLRLLEDLASLAASGSVRVLLNYLFSKTDFKFCSAFWQGIENFQFSVIINCKIKSFGVLTGLYACVIVQATWLRVSSLQRTFVLDILE